MNGMTGYSNIERVLSDASIITEVKTVNSRYLDFNFILPPQLKTFEQEFKEIIQKDISRGKVDIYISLKILNNTQELIPDIEVAKKYTLALKQIVKECKIRDSVKLEHLLGFGEIIRSSNKEGPEKYIDTIKEMIIENIKEVVKMRKQEGQSTLINLRNILSDIKRSTEEIKIKSSDIDKLYFNMLKGKISELVGDKADETRIVNEAAILSSKSCINEEIHRLSNHITVFEKISETEPQASKKLDFLCQEMVREINTIGSKVSIIDLTDSVITVKNRIEQIREQLRNVE